MLKVARSRSFDALNQSQDNGYDREKDARTTHPRRNRETREGSSLNRHDRDNSSGGGSRVRGSVNRDMTPNKLGKQL